MSAGDLSGAGNFEPELRELRAENAALKKQLAEAQAGRAAMHTALSETLEAIDMVESEPGRIGHGPIFKVDWLATMKLVRDLPDVKCLEQYVEAALRARAEVES